MAKFADTTTLHGPKRIYNGKGWSCVFWVFIWISSMIMLLTQVTSLISMYISKPTVSQVSFTFFPMRNLFENLLKQNKWNFLFEN